MRDMPSKINNIGMGYNKRKLKSLKLHYLLHYVSMTRELIFLAGLAQGLPSGRFRMMCRVWGSRINTAVLTLWWSIHRDIMLREVWIHKYLEFWGCGFEIFSVNTHTEQFWGAELHIYIPSDIGIYQGDKLDFSFKDHTN